MENSSKPRWSLSDYKRRVSSTATVKAFYGSGMFFDRLSCRSTRGSASNDSEGTLGLAAGGQMYGGRDDFRLLSFHLLLEQSAENIP